MSPFARPLPSMQLTEESTTIDVIRFLETATSDNEISAVAEILNHQGKALFGEGFGLHFDPTIMSSDIRKRVFITIPGLQRRKL
jgi:hypothetical protein